MLLRLILFLQCLLCSLVYANTSPSVALFYGANPPLAELRAFDVAVVDPNHANIHPQSYNSQYSQLFAYVSVGEVHPSKPYFKQIPKSWLKSQNQAWQSTIIDQSVTEWPQFFANTVIAPLWDQGYRGFFLDTLDSYQLIAKTPEQKKQQEAGLKNLIREIKQRWPEAKLIFNRGFEILPEVHNLAWMVAAESLYQSWNAKTQSYQAVTTQDRTWLSQKLQNIHQQYQLPILAIDYVPTPQRELARQTAAKIKKLGFSAWVSNPTLDALGISSEVEVLPRKVLVIYNPAEAPDLHYQDVVRFLGAPLAYLGLVPEYIPYNSTLPQYDLTGRYAGIISWINSDDIATNSAYPQWLTKQIQQQIPVAIFSRFGVAHDSGLLQTLGLKYQELEPTQSLQLMAQDTMMGFEFPVTARAHDIYPVSINNKNSTPLVSLTTKSQAMQWHPAALTSWGGYALAPYVVEMLPAKDAGERWVINPLTFLSKALKLDENRPIPDVTTENGRRLLMVHIDGDGFMSIAERPDRPFNGQVMLNDFFKRYQIPTTMSVIEGEIGKTGLYPELSPQLEKIARDIYALPWVELASHSYSHPFYWSKAEAAADNADDYEAYHLPIKNYLYSSEREIKGSIDYINQTLAPKNKQVKVFLWTGNCVSTPNALAQTVEAGVLNMNGGDTTITRSNNSWTRIAGLGIKKGDYFQVFAPNQNENVYTNLWTGPFYGFERVLETYQLTDSPYRFKPIDIYFHAYLVSKTAGTNSLHKIYQWALKQATFPIYSSEYIKKVLDFNQFVVARTPQGYRFRGNGDLRTVRLASATQTDFAQSPTVLGFNEHNQQYYVHLAQSNADIIEQEKATLSPYIESSNATIKNFKRQNNDLFFDIAGFQAIQLVLANTRQCQLKQGNKVLKTRRQGSRLFLEDAAHELSSLRLSCPS
ncbi:MAG: bifunctional glycoside hydrolase 114/ polysaccharide deacetylase family protein [Agitococcus sp.]